MNKYVFGDIHGCFQELKILVDKVEQHAKGKPHIKIFLGDYVDRGPESRQVIDFLMEMPGRNYFLMGNHERMMIDSVENPNSQMTTSWLVNGGGATLNSYPDGKVSQQHIDWLKGLSMILSDGLRTYVHSGIDPDKSIKDQTENDCLWSRKKFLKHGLPFEKYIVHGHTPESDWPVVLHNRCNLDTGGVFNMKFSVGVFNDSQAEPIDIIQTRLIEKR